MKNSADIKGIWKQVSVEQILSLEEVVSAAVKLKTKTYTKLIASIVLGMLSVAVVMLFGFLDQSTNLTSRIGIIAIAFSVLIYCFGALGLLKFIIKEDLSLTNQGYIEQLRALKTKQLVFQKFAMNSFFALLSLGVLLYLYKYTFLMSTGYAVASYLLTLSWLAYNWIFVRRRIATKQTHEISKLIEKFEMLEKEMSADS